MKTEEEYRAKVLQLMRDLYPTLKGEEKERAERLFPELKVGGDERVWLTKFLQKEIDWLRFDWRDNDDRIKLANLQRSLAWLEKQGEYANFRNKIQIGDKVTRNKDGVLVNLSQLARIAKKNENQCEQQHFNDNFPSFDEAQGTIVVEKQGEKGTNGNNREIPNTAWGEEDNVRQTSTIQVLEYAKSLDDYNQYGKMDIRNNIIWLKSLKDRNTWKPSDEQIKALDIAIRCGIQLGTWEECALKSLKEQLKKFIEN